MSTGGSFGSVTVDMVKIGAVRSETRWRVRRDTVNGENGGLRADVE